MVPAPLFQLILNLLVQLPSDLTSEEEAALLSACGQVSAPQKCERASPEAKSTSKIERVSSERFLMEVVVNTAQRERLISREFTFKSEDEPLERARALGLSLGLLARTSSTDAVNEEEATTPTPSPAPLSTEPMMSTEGKRPSARREGRQRPSVYSEVSAGIGADLGLSAPVFGGSFKAWMAPTSRMFTGVGLAVAGTRATDSALRVVRVSPLVWFRYLVLSTKRVSIGCDLGAGAENLAISSTASKTRGSRWVPVLRLATPMQLHLGKFSYFLITPEVQAHMSSTQVYLDEILLDESSAVIPALQVGFGLGL